ncbi:hypothetical protein [Streptomyces rhizosphaericola]|uniref:LPXTG cell wall anchor domain-containing protein n=1 Tax=Streptomyces rhizosphaericola TaxID=2564098 RepID=A0ABY2PGK0_9ACTN|nr:hypothetical protein [Streptomyces rhizosphaericola]TGZ09943.1 hypothetical protein E5Z02_12560 [Streptomyces rhizosphaericola]
MKRRHIALLAAASVATPALLGVAPALAVTGSARTLSVRETGEVRGVGPASVENAVVARLKGVPETFVAGGDWEEFDLVLDNISQDEISGVTLDMQVITIVPDPALHPAHMNVQTRSGGSWVDARLVDMGPRDVNAELPVRPMVLPPGKTTIRLRMKFSADAPTVELYLGPEPDEHHATEDEDYWVATQIVHRAAPSPDPSTDPDPSTKPDPDPEPEPEPEPSADPEPGPSTGPDPSSGPDPSADPGSGPSATPDPASSAHPLPAPEPTGSDSALSGGAGQAAVSGAEGGGLARTGSDAATKWALGAGGTLVVLGAALAVAGRQARRRRAHR